MTTKIAIFGVGLIGGSLALCFRGKPGVEVVGHSPRSGSLEVMLDRGVVDFATLSMEEAVRDADFIFLCVPVGNLEEYLEKLYELPLKPGCIITDVGSTKASIAAAAEKLSRPDVYFIGGHPMAGSERSGVEAASTLLFENAYYVLTPATGVPDEAYAKLEELLQYTRAQVVRVNPVQHDEIVGAISHLPHIIAVALVNQVCDYNASNGLYRTLAAGGFRDITRIASSDPIIWRDILLSNRDVVLSLLKDWNEEIGGFISMLEGRNGEGIVDSFVKANRFRSELPERRKGMISSLFDLYIDVPDHPGIIGQITTELGDQNINLSNIQIIESREDVPGLLHLSFRQESAMERAKEHLQSMGYAVYV
ncbi:prephenate dehydrogenase [Paenibacillus motobuensis]|uniref:prephenate dehydrogenase n=1 Tax=Paenibacillus TaxID=44249 RepID=UPI00203F1C2C|nr:MULTISPECIES: prephenate dehydrogenase [Paenibacillus]MCM3040139.1 prephenate dehydrogenase [Paenibacillus lutimineralis]MCM3647243.1 prephenate dehydrogenase [Paenibacillus motobuensis]